MIIEQDLLLRSAIEFELRLLMEVLELNSISVADVQSWLNRFVVAENESTEEIGVFCQLSSLIDFCSTKR